MCVSVKAQPCAACFAGDLLGDLRAFINSERSSAISACTQHTPRTLDMHAHTRQPPSLFQGLTSRLVEGFDAATLVYPSSLGQTRRSANDPKPPTQQCDANATAVCVCVCVRACVWMCVCCLEVGEEHVIRYDETGDISFVVHSSLT